MPLLPHPPKFYEALHEAAHRRATRLYLAIGRKLLEEALRSLPPAAFHAVLLAQESQACALPPPLANKVFILPAWQIARISKQENPEGVVAVLHQCAPPLPEAMPPAVLGEGLQDPGNVGTLLRTMEWLGWHTLWLSERSVDPYHPKVVRASMGSIFRVQAFRVENWAALLRAYEHRCVVADLSGMPPEEIAWQAYDSLYIGSEAHGPRLAPATWPRVCIPPAPTAQADSLNVTIAAALLLYTRREIIAGRLHT
ncbi:MAG: RNA methyltransferase [Bacteroidia bacterium]|jgi:TrmH family RNA methyltransferase|nr:RNA methyltransferase [Bacteroidia bacterium]GIV23524.1 MAG: tRNA/rRNA methyltransferase SpoU [Bacteroidia bacterium]